MDFDWAETLHCAVTVCDTQGVVIYMNQCSRATFSNHGDSMVGKSMMPCHNEHSQAIIHKMLNEDVTNCYTIDKQGVRKLIYQTPWKKDDGTVGGLVEISIVLPDELTNYVR
ncbi:MAG: PAS domain-containing protein [Muribaculaceae bacterium]|nr:PAS domain-containing protein [Muribaculaceae bacterium]MBR6284461.1 PAS domain-containing protein [Muribaculaceae bacterium]